MLQYYEFLIHRISEPTHMRGLLKCEKFKYHAIKMMGEKALNERRKSNPKKKSKQNQTKQNKK